jgi:hypothetical protein
MLHDAAGNVLVSQIVRLRPGQTTFLDYRVTMNLPTGDANQGDGTVGSRTTPLERLGIVPCILPDPERGRMLPTVEVFDSTTGQTAFVVGPVTPRLSFVKSLVAEPR